MKILEYVARTAAVHMTHRSTATACPGFAHWDCTGFPPLSLVDSVTPGTSTTTIWVSAEIVIAQSLALVFARCSVVFVRSLLGPLLTLSATPGDAHFAPVRYPFLLASTLLAAYSTTARYSTVLPSLLRIGSVTPSSSFTIRITALVVVPEALSSVILDYSAMFQESMFVGLY